jgi:iron complex transport system ATP-binding protein
MDVRREDHEITEQVLARLGLGGMALRYIDELSGGEFQKVMLARALSQKSKVLLLDEPTSNLDLKNQYEILTLVREIAVAEMISVIMVIHDLNLALRFCDAFLLIRDGRVFAHGGLEVITHENIEAIYGIPVYIETVRGVTVVIPASPSGQPPLISEPLTLPALDNILTMTV